MTIGWPQGIYLLLVLIGVVHECRMHGRLDGSGGRHNALGHIVVTALVLALLYWGGFFQGGAA